MICDCPVCKGKDHNPDGIKLAEKEVIPFIKRDLLQLKYPTHPFPLRYDGLLASVLCFSQALSYNRAHGIEAVYYTENKWLLRFSKELNVKFGMPILHKSELKTIPKLVCEYNVENN